MADKVRIRRVVRSRGWAHPGFRLPVWLLAAALVLLGLCLALAALPFMEKGKSRLPYRPPEKPGTW